MKLSAFEESVIRLDAEYFLEQGFIDVPTHRSVTEWLLNKDTEVPPVIIKWLRADARYGNKIMLSAAEHFWYIAPFIVLGLRIITRMLFKRAESMNEHPIISAGKAVGQKVEAL